MHRDHLAGHRQTRLTLTSLHHFHLAVWGSNSGNAAAAKCCAVTSSASHASFARTREPSEVGPSVDHRCDSDLAHDSDIIVVAGLAGLAVLSGLSCHGTLGPRVGEHMAAAQSGAGSGESSVRVWQNEAVEVITVCMQLVHGASPSELLVEPVQHVLAKQGRDLLDKATCSF